MLDLFRTMLDNFISLRVFSKTSHFNRIFTQHDLLSNSVAISQKGLFKCCLFDARKTIQLERDGTGAFKFNQLPELDYEVVNVKASDVTRPHSYFEDGKDPDEQLQLPKKVIKCVFELNQIHHTGCIIFEALPDRMKIHHYYRLLDASKEVQFKRLQSARHLAH